MLDIVHKTRSSYSIWSLAIKRSNEETEILPGGIFKTPHLDDKLFCSRWHECLPPQEMDLYPEILIIHIDKANKMWEGINRCLGKRGTEKRNDLPKGI